MRIYMDNSATSFPKPDCVIKAMTDYMSNIGSSVSRSTSSQASATSDRLFELRELLADLFGAKDSRNVVFTKNITESLNIIIHGFIQPGDKVLVSSLEHNAVMRPLTQKGAEILAIPTDPKGILDLDFVRRHLPSVKAFLCTHVSNVSGDVLPIELLASMSKEQQVPFILDSAQSAGLLPIDLRQIPIDGLCFTGHKALLGPSGTGGMILSKSFAKVLPPFITGGTGSRSDDEIHPVMMPDKFEAGTPNIVGLIGLSAAIEEIKKEGIHAIFKQETRLGIRFFDMLSSLKGLDIIGSQDYPNKPPVFSLNFKNIDNAKVSYLLSEKYHIDNRCGLHCAPRAHKTYGTYPHGTVRLSLSRFTTEDQLETAFQALRTILSEH